MSILAGCGRRSSPVSVHKSGCGRLKYELTARRRPESEVIRIQVSILFHSSWPFVSSPSAQTALQDSRILQLGMECGKENSSDNTAENTASLVKEGLAQMFIDGTKAIQTHKCDSPKESK